jgi:hypothetical protein
MALYTTSYGVTTASISCLNFNVQELVNFNGMTKLFSIYNSFFQALVVSCAISPSVNSSVWESGTYCTWVFSKSVNPSPATLQVSMWMFPIAFYWLKNPWKPLTVLGQSVFQQPFKAMDFIIHAFVYIYYAVCSAMQFPAFSNTNRSAHLQWEYCWRCSSTCNGSRMLWRFPGQVAAELRSLIRQILNFGIQIGKTKILQTPRSITKDTGELECWILGLQVEFLNMPLLVYGPG